MEGGNQDNWLERWYANKWQNSDC